MLHCTATSLEEELRGMVWNARQFAKPLSGMLSALLNLPNTFLKTMRVASSTITSLPKSRRTPAIMASVTRGPELRHGLCIGGGAIICTRVKRLFSCSHAEGRAHPLSPSNQVSGASGALASISNRDRLRRGRSRLCICVVEKRTRGLGSLDYLPCG